MKKENIPAHLKEIEEKHHVRVLLAVESGSRAWGFESLDSDWDLRFVYVHEPEYYFRIKDQRDVIEYVFDDDCDAVGWELKKALRLFAKCNMSLLEWINSPIVYFQDKEFVERIKGIQEKCFNPIGAMYHYNSIYNKINEVYLDDAEAPLKKFLYYLRGIFACDCIYNKRMMPPVNFYTLLGKCDIDDNIRTEISKLLSIKKHNKESDISNVNKELKAFAKERAEFYNNAISTYRPEDQREDVYSELDKLAFDMICKIC